MMLYGFIGVGTAARVGYIVMQMLANNIDHDVARKKITNTIKGAILATILNSLIAVIKKYYGG